MTINNKFEITYRFNKFFGFALAAPILVYAVLVEVLRYREVTVHALDPAVLANLRLVFVFCSFALYLLINFLNKKILVKKPGDTPETLLRKLTIANVVCLGLSELPALFGLILFLGSGEPRDFYLLLIISVLLFYAFFPSYRFWANWSTAATSTSP